MTLASRFKQDEIEMISNQCKIPERHNFFPAMLLWIAVAGKAWIAYHWVTEKKSNMALTNQWRSYNFDKLRKEESSLSYKVIARENEGSRPSCEWKWGAQGDWKVQPFSQDHNPHGKAIENPSGLPKPSPRRWLKPLQANLQAHLEAMHALSSDTTENFTGSSRIQGSCQDLWGFYKDLQDTCKDL